MTIAKQLNDIETKLDKIAAALGIEVDNPAVAAIKGDTTFGQQVIDVVSARMGISPVDVKSHRRAAIDSLARRVICYMLKKHSTYSLPRIGTLIDKDHTTVYWYLAQMKRCQKENKEQYKYLMSVVKYAENQLGLSSEVACPVEHIA